MALAVDGFQVGGGVSSNTGAFAGSPNNLTTTLNNNVIVVDVFSAALSSAGARATVSSISSPNTTGWTKKSEIFGQGGPDSSFNSIERWYGFAAGPLTQEQITVTFNTAVDESVSFVYAVNGVDQSTPWDVNSNASKSASNSTFAAVTVGGISTTNPHCFICVGWGIPDNDERDTATIAGVDVFSALIQFTNNLGTRPHPTTQGVTSLITTSALSSQSAALGSGNPNGFYLLADALQEAATSATFVLGDRVLDFGLNELDSNCDKIHVCAAGTLASYSDVLSLTLGDNNFGGAGLAFGAPSAGSPTGRKSTSPAITKGTITTAGTAFQWAAVDSINSRLLAVGPLSGGKAVSLGQFFTLDAIAIHLKS